MNIEKRIRELEERIEDLEKNPEEEVSTDQSLEDFVEKVEPESHQQYAVTMGYYHDVMNGKKFAINEASECLLGCRWSEYSNMRMLRSQLLDQKERVREYGENEDGETIYILTKEGKDFMEGRLNEE